MTERPEEDLQFEQAEYLEEDDASSACATCAAPLQQEYYVANGETICAACRSGLSAFLAGGSRFGRFLRALIAGLVGGAVGAGIYFGIARLTGYEIGLVALVVGLLVGFAVRWGAEGRGGWFYQSLAIVITYCSIVVAYVPEIVSQINSPEARSGMIEDHEGRDIARITIMRDQSIKLNGDAITLQALESRLQALQAADGVVWYHREDFQEQPPSQIAEAVWLIITDLQLTMAAFKDAQFQEPLSLWEAAIASGPLGTAVMTALVFVVALVAPLMTLPDNLIGLLIIGIALYEAWKINKRVSIEVSGPFEMATLERAPPSAGGGA